MTMEEQWQTISTPNKRFLITLRVDGEVIEETGFGMEKDEAVASCVDSWSQPLYESEVVEVISVREIII